MYLQPITVVWISLNVNWKREHIVFYIEKSIHSNLSFMYFLFYNPFARKYIYKFNLIYI